MESTLTTSNPCAEVSLAKVTSCVLPHEIKECNNCKHHVQAADPWPEPCRDCMIAAMNDMGLVNWEPKEVVNKASNDGSTADYYVLPEGAKQLQDLIAFRDMNAQVGEIFRATYRYGQGHHSSRERDLKKIIFYAQAELERLEKYG